MSVPTEAGCYYWTPGCVRSEDAIIVRVDHELWATSEGGGWSGDLAWKEWAEGEWGPRIPSPERLAALEAVLAAVPERAVYVTVNGGTSCGLCHAPVYNLAVGNGDQFLTARQCTHAADCPWLLAQPHAASEKPDTPA